MNISTVTKTFYDFMEMTDEIDRILGYGQRGCGKHFHPNTGDFDDWHKSKGYGRVDPEGKHIGDSQIWYAEYQKNVDDNIFKETPYMDFWHWQLDNCMNNGFCNDSYGYVNISMWCADEAEDWQKEIQQVWHDTFKDIADEEGIVEIQISW